MTEVNLYRYVGTGVSTTGMLKNLSTLQRSHLISIIASPSIRARKSNAPQTGHSTRVRSDSCDELSGSLRGSAIALMK